MPPSRRKVGEPNEFASRVAYRFSGNESLGFVVVIFFEVIRLVKGCPFIIITIVPLLVKDERCTPQRVQSARSQRLKTFLLAVLYALFCGQRTYAVVKISTTTKNRKTKNRFPYNFQEYDVRQRSTSINMIPHRVPRK